MTTLTQRAITKGLSTLVRNNISLRFVNNLFGALYLYKSRGLNICSLLLLSNLLFLSDNLLSQSNHIGAEAYFASTSIIVIDCNKGINQSSQLSSQYFTLVGLASSSQFILLSITDHIKTTYSSLKKQTDSEKGIHPLFPTINVHKFLTTSPIAIDAMGFAISLTPAFNKFEKLLP